MFDQRHSARCDLLRVFITELIKRERTSLGNLYRALDRIRHRAIEFGDLIKRAKMTLAIGKPILMNVVNRRTAANRRHAIMHQHAIRRVIVNVAGSDQGQIVIVRQPPQSVDVFIIVDAPYKTGDYIILASGERGLVTDIGLRSTRILTRDDIEITVPNGIIGNGKIINEAGGPSAQYRLRIAVGVAYGSDIDHVIETLEKVAARNTDILKSPAPRVRFRNFGDSSLDFELLGWIARPVDRGRVKHELNCAVYKAFNESNIEIPFPQRDLHVRTMPQATG